MDNSVADDIISIQIDIDDTEIEPAELDELTRRLAANLRNLPHESVGILIDQAPASPSTAAAPAKTLGIVTMSLRKAILAKAIEVVRQESLACNARRFRVTGPNEIQLDCTGSVASELVTAWLNGVTEKTD